MVDPKNNSSSNMPISADSVSPQNPFAKKPVASTPYAPNSSVNPQNPLARPPFALKPLVPATLPNNNPNFIKKEPINEEEEKKHKRNQLILIIANAVVFVLVVVFLILFLNARNNNPNLGNSSVGGATGNSFSKFELQVKDCLEKNVYTEECNMGFVNPKISTVCNKFTGDLKSRCDAKSVAMQANQTDIGAN